MTQIFNSTFEISMRVLLILYITKKDLNIDMITNHDLLTTYGENYEISDYNLHGDNSFSFSEITSRRKKVQDSIKELVLNNLIIPLTTKEGFKYRINCEGKKICSEMSTDYANDYIESARLVDEFFSNKTEQEIMNYINKYSIRRSDD